MTKRAIRDQFAGQYLGAAWAVLHPMLLMAVYLFLFGVVLGVRAGGAAKTGVDYSAFLLSGLIPWLSFQDSMARTTPAVTSNADLVKQVVFPLEVLPVRAVLSVLPAHLVSLALFLVYLVVRFGAPTAMWLWTPVLLLLQVVAMVGTGYCLAALCVFFRDLKELVRVFTLVGLYVTPIVYQASAVPEPVRWLLDLNPFAHLVWCHQDVFFHGRFEHGPSWLVLVGLSLVMLVVGQAVFSTLRPRFGNTL
jgi:lipopolysaccharide transport system permease protein